MSMLRPTPPGRRSDLVGEKIASFPTYEAAQKAVSQLIAGDVPARAIAIVGMGLRSIERVTGRLGYATAARSGAVNGILIGLFFSAILVLGNPSVPIQVFVGVLFVGIALGMLLSIIMYSFIRRRRDYASVMHVLAEHYDVTVDAAHVATARRALGAPGAEPATGASEVPPAGEGSVDVPGDRPPLAPEASPPRYGERIERDASETASA